MAFKLMEQEASYLELLKETKMLKHVGSGPVDPAPKEKETKSPVEDGKGAGTAQSSTGHPNKIPPIAYLKKELAKEGINIYGNELSEWVEQIKALTEDQQATVRQKISEAKGMCPECKCDPCECSGDDDDSDDDEDDKKKVSKEVSELMQKPGQGYEKGIVQGKGLNPRQMRMMQNKKKGRFHDGGPLASADTMRSYNVRGKEVLAPATSKFREDIEAALEHCGECGVGDKKKKIKEAELSGQANAVAADAGSQSLDMEKIDDKDLNKDDDNDNSPGGVDEQMAAAPGAAAASTGGSGAISAGNIARSDGASLRSRRPVPEQYSKKVAARMAAIKSANQALDARMRAKKAPAAIKTAPAPPTRPVRTSDRVSGEPTRPLRSRI